MPSMSFKLLLQQLEEPINLDLQQQYICFQCNPQEKQKQRELLLCITFTAMAMWLDHCPRG